ncbi:MAG TPA: pyrroloquinoline quinone biosynthesis peptide chaperone PqqD [Stellaceae bacterium]|jgi:pyrroloquinoline quinone biosynthesis protein D
MTAAERRCVVGGETALRFAAHVRFRFDKVRERWVVLAPEKLVLPDEPAVEILKQVDGSRTVDAIVDDLASRFDAPREVIATDVTALLQDLADQGVLVA